MKFCAENTDCYFRSVVTNMATVLYQDVIFSLFGVCRICANVLSYLKTLSNNNNNNNT